MACLIILNRMIKDKEPTIPANDLDSFFVYEIGNDKPRRNSGTNTPQSIPSPRSEFGTDRATRQVHAGQVCQLLAPKNYKFQGIGSQRISQTQTIALVGPLLHQVKVLVLADPIAFDAERSASPR
jgi:hypothetical protein